MQDVHHQWHLDAISHFLPTNIPMKRSGSSQENQGSTSAMKKQKSASTDDDEVKRLRIVVDELCAALSRKSEELRTASLTQHLELAEEVLGQMEEVLNCPLCHEIVASPHMLSPALCGHSFCAICGLRWYFSALDVDETGVSHRLLNCPLCKSDLPEFPIFDELRDQWAFPFLPNRLAEDSLDCHFLTFDSAIRSASDLLRSGLRPTQKEHQDHQSNVGLPDLPGLNLGKGVRNWMKGGEDRVRWEKRARLGKEKMELLIKMWESHPADEFADFKEGLGPLGS